MNAFLEVIASNAVAATLMAAATLVLGRFWKNSAAIHLLWVLVLLKLFLPPVWMAPLPAGWLGSWAEPAAADAPPPSEGRLDPVGPIARGEVGPQTAAQEPGESQPAGSAPPIVLSARGPASLPALVLTAWCLGAVVQGGRYAYRIHRFRSVLISADRPPAVIQEQVTQLATRMNLGDSPEAQMTTHTLPPLVWRSARRPLVLLPTQLFSRLDASAQRMVIAHELAHVERRDHLVRLLELASCTLFWWHPVVWLARHQLHLHEEECCDRRALEVTADSPKAYAGVLVDTLDFLAESPRLTAPLFVTAYSAGSFSRRIRMLSESRSSRLSRVSLAIVLLLSAVPLVTAFAGEAADPKDREVQNDGDTAQQAVLTGRVVDQNKQPVEGARVLVAIPAIDMRFASTREDVKFYETTTNAEGSYRLPLPGVTQPTEVSTNVTKPSYRSSAGTLMHGGDFRRPRVEPGKETTHSYELEPALYFKGVVVNEQDEPIPGVTVAANLNTERSSAGIERTVSDADGRFELFNYQEEFRAYGDGTSVGRVGFIHPTFVGATVEDVYKLKEGQRDQLRVVLPTGRALTGRVLSSAGRPVRNVAVRLRRDDGGEAKGVLTDQNGGFRFAGIRQGEVSLKVHDLTLNEKTKVSVDLRDDASDVEVSLSKVPLTSEPSTTAVLGMQLCSVNDELASKYDLYPELKGKGALILRPGADHARLDIGELVEGNLFFMVGETRIADVREFVARIIEEAEKQDGDQYSVRVVYTFTELNFDGTNTQYMQLTPADIEHLRAVLRELDEG